MPPFQCEPVSLQYGTHPHSKLRIGGTIAHETLKASDLRDRYLDRLAARKAELADLTRATGWRLGLHHTSDSAQSALLWLYRALDGGTA